MNIQRLSPVWRRLHMGERLPLLSLKHTLHCLPLGFTWYLSFFCIQSPLHFQRVSQFHILLEGFHNHPRSLLLGTSEPTLCWVLCTYLPPGCIFCPCKVCPRNCCKLLEEGELLCSLFIHLHFFSLLWSRFMLKKKQRHKSPHGCHRDHTAHFKDEKIKVHEDSFQNFCSENLQNSIAGLECENIALFIFIRTFHPHPDSYGRIDHCFSAVTMVFCFCISLSELP